MSPLGAPVQDTVQRACRQPCVAGVHDMLLAAMHVSTGFRIACPTSELPVQLRGALATPQAGPPSAVVQRVLLQTAYWLPHVHKTLVSCYQGVRRDGRLFTMGCAACSVFKFHTRVFRGIKPSADVVD